uniref:Beta-defensin n=1 Tax=Peromyscus maniculatus bairdii TaxID=230844 RepID=A0A8C8W1B6_PERMB
MKLPALLLILFCFLDLLCTVKADMKDTYFCFLKRGKCRHVCKGGEREAGFCTKLKANCCMFAPEMKALYPEDQSTVSIKISNKQNWVTKPSHTVHVVPSIKWCCWRIFSLPRV